MIRRASASPTDSKTKVPGSGTAAVPAAELVGTALSPAANTAKIDAALAPMVRELPSGSPPASETLRSPPLTSVPPLYVSAELLRTRARGPS